MRNGRWPHASAAHAGLNHAGPLANAANADRLSAQSELDRDLLGQRVAGHDGFERMIGTFGSVVEQPERVEDARFHVLHRHRDADAPGRADQDVFCPDVASRVPTRIRRLRTADSTAVQCFGRDTRHFYRVLQALPASAGIGVARIHYDGLGNALFHALQADFHRRGANLVRREHAGDRRRDFRNDEREVAFPAFRRAFSGAEAFDVAEDPGGQEAFRSDDGAGNFS